MRNLVKVIVFLSFISGLVFAQSTLTSTTAQPISSVNSPAIDTGQLLINLILNLSANPRIDNSLLDLLNKLLQQSGSTNFQTTSTSLATPVFDNNRDNDVLIQINNLRITKIVPAQDLNAKAYFYVVKDVGWNCTFYEKVGTNISSFCPLNIRKIIIQREIVVRANNDTILLLRNRERTNINQFNVGDKINIYGFFDKDNFTFDALVMRKIVAAPKPLPIPTVPSPVFPTPTETSPIGKPQERWFVGYLERMRQSSTAVESVTSSEYLYYLTTDNNLVYSVKPGDDRVRELLDKYSGQRVRLYGIINNEASRTELGLLIAKEVVPLSSMGMPTSTVNVISGLLSKTGESIYMWGTHTLNGDDGKTYQVKALNDKVLEDLKKFTGKKVTIYAKKVYFNNLEGGFWAIEAEKVVPLR